MLPPFHGERMREYATVMQEAADRAIDSLAGRAAVPRCCPSMQSLTLDVIMSAVFGIERGPRQEELKRRIRAMIEPVASRAGLLADGCCPAAASAPSGLRAVRAAPARPRRADLRGDRRPPRRAGPRGARGRLLDAAARARRGRRGDDRPRAARRARDAAGRRPRDDRDRPGLGVRAAAAQPARPGAAARRRWRRATRPTSTRS